jgi:hypothetical protein
MPMYVVYRKPMMVYKWREWVNLRMESLFDQRVSTKSAGNPSSRTQRNLRELCVPILLTQNSRSKQHREYTEAQSSQRGCENPRSLGETQLFVLSSYTENRISFT